MKQSDPLLMELEKKRNQRYEPYCELENSMVNQIAFPKKFSSALGIVSDPGSGSAQNIN